MKNINSITSVLDTWLEVKSQEILSKIDNEIITTQDMLVLILRSQSRLKSDDGDYLPGNLKPIDPKIKARALEEIEKEFDFSKLESKVVTINLDNRIIDYFKMLAEKTGKGYQALIREALHHIMDEKLEPKTICSKSKD